MKKLPDSLSEHKIAKMHPLYTDEQFIALKLDIDKRGQKVPIILYRGKVVDGRHRLRAIKELGLQTIICTELSSRMTLEQVIKEVNTTEIRRHQSPTQLAIKANKLYERSNKELTLEQAVKQSQATNTNTKRVRQLIKMGRRDLVDMLERGMLVDTSLESFSTPTDSLAAVITFAKSTDAKLSSCVDDKSAEFDEPKPTSINSVGVSSVVSMIKALGLSKTDILAIVEKVA